MLWKFVSLKKFFYKWIEFSKSVYRVSNDSRVCLHLILFPSLRIMSWRKQKYAQYKTFEQLPLYSAKVTHTWMLQMRNSRDSNIQLRSQALHFAKICSLKISRRNWSHVHGNLFKFRRFYRFFLNINFISFYFHFLQRMLSHPFCYLKRALCKARKSWTFKIFSLRSVLSARRR